MENYEKAEKDYVAGMGYMHGYRDFRGLEEDGLPVTEDINAKAICDKFVEFYRIFEYFNHYLPIQGAEERTPSENKALLKYEHEIRRHSKETQEWLCRIYCETGHKLSITIMKYLRKYPEFFLFYQENEIRNISYNCYAEIVKNVHVLRTKQKSCIG